RGRGKLHQTGAAVAADQGVEGGVGQRLVRRSAHEVPNFLVARGRAAGQGDEGDGEPAAVSMAFDRGRGIDDIRPGWRRSERFTDVEGQEAERFEVRVLLEREGERDPGGDGRVRYVHAPRAGARRGSRDEEREPV